MSVIASEYLKASYTFRQRKGYGFERVIGRLLDRAGISYESNPLDSIVEWAHSVGRGCDFHVGPIEIEAKYTHAKMYVSWVCRDWLSRFSKSAAFKVIVINRGMQLSNAIETLLWEHNIDLVYYDELVPYLIELLPRVAQTLQELKDIIFPKCNKDPVCTYKDHIPVPCTNLGERITNLGDSPGKMSKPLDLLILGYTSNIKQLTPEYPNLFILLLEYLLIMYYELIYIIHILSTPSSSSLQLWPSSCGI